MAFKKGQVGNPLGRAAEGARKNKQIADLLLPLVAETIEQLKGFLSSEDESIRLSAVKDILNRVYGMPKQPTEHSGDLFKGIRVIVERG